EMPDALDRNRYLLDRLEAIRSAASIRMGIAASKEMAAAKPSIPKIAMIAPPQAAGALSGIALSAEDADITVRMISIGQPHRAAPLTGAMCLAVAARLEGSVVHKLARPLASPEAPIRIAQPSGLTVVGASVRRDRAGWIADHATVYRTARRLMEGVVYVRASTPLQPVR
ncbi:MAG TPA: PrpF domain-containing protein, partial [Candidatus Binataceae bacterium]|nr:PrpF domain-containing protein [Candidatus Binataceae bacterium]